jgi:hypothetical protein
MLVPLMAMLFTDEVKWGPGDFVVMGALLFGAGMTYEFLAKKTRKRGYRIAIGFAVLAAVLIIWAELAVDIFSQLLVMF